MHIDETLNRIQTQKGVLGVLVTNHEGLVMRSNLDNVQTTQLASLSAQLSTLARHAVRDIDPEVSVYSSYIKSCSCLIYFNNLE